MAGHHGIFVVVSRPGVCVMEWEGRQRGKADNEFDVDRDNERAGIRIENISSPKLQTRSGVRDQRMWVTERLPNGNLQRRLV